jgi:hypothetical protein
MEKDLFEGRCSEDDPFFISIRAIETHTFYSDQGERLAQLLDRSKKSPAAGLTLSGIRLHTARMLATWIAALSHI